MQQGHPDPSPPRWRWFRTGLYPGHRRSVAVALALALALAGASHAQTQRTRNIQVKPSQRLGDVTLDMRLETAAAAGGVRGRSVVRSGEAVPVGTRVIICFTAGERGYVTVWSRDAEGNVPVRIYPNEYASETAGEVAAPVEARAETCLGDDDDFRLEVGPPVGEAEVYLHYTRDEALQFDETAYPQIRATRAPDTRPYASRHLTYRVVD